LEPADIFLDDHVLDLCFSPCANVLALAQVTGEVRVYSYKDEVTTEQLHLTYHTDSCRAVAFSPDGNIIYTGSKDRSLAAVTDGKLAGRILEAHPAPVFTILHMEGGHIVASGDDDGMIRIWDLRMAHQGRKHAICMEFNEHEGTVLDLALNTSENMLLSGGGDGMLGVYDLRKKELYAMSDNFEEDLTTVTLQKDEKKVLTSTSEGTINIFSWDYFGDCNDRIVGHPGSIDCMIKYDEDTVITGCEDGLIRAVSVLPNKIIAVLGDPLDAHDDVFHVQKISLSHDKRLLVSCSLDDIVRIIDVANLAERVRDEEDFDEAAYEAQIQERNYKKAGDKSKAKEEAKLGGDQQMEDEEGGDESDAWADSSDESSSDAEDQKKGNAKKDKHLNPKKATLQQSKKMLEDHKRKDFFGDL